MKLLHTADWHLNDRLGRIDRTSDLRGGVERIAAYCESERIDVLLVAGDLFSELARPDALRETVRHLRETFSPFLGRGGTILAVTGNHDNETFCQTLRHAMSLAAGEPVNGKLMPGRFFLATRPTAVTLQSPAGFDVSFALMPWPTATQYPEAVAGATTPEDKTRRLAAAFKLAMAELAAPAPAVLVAHVNVADSTIGPGGFRLGEQENVTIDAADLAGRYAYAALGHVHKPQAVGGHANVRYSGSLDRLDLGEQLDAKGCVVLELGPKELVGEPSILPLSATPVYPVIVVDPELDLPRLREEHSDAASDLVNLTLRYDAARHRLEDLLAESAAIFPRWYQRDWKDTSELGPTLSPAESPERTKGFAETVREYVTQELIQHAPEVRDNLLARLDDLLATGAA
jgi:exonuclease SbcD